jgi:hypothetical protein
MYTKLNTVAAAGWKRMERARRSRGISTIPPEAHTMTFPSRHVPAIALALLAATAPSASAQSAGDGYLFHPPNATVTVSAGFARASAGGDVFQDVTKNLTLSRGDFDSFALGADIAVPVTRQVEVMLSAGVSRSKKSSEYRDFVETVDGVDVPIRQTNTFERVPLTVNLKVDLLPTGRSVGSLAWIPNRVVPYVGGGVGAMHYRFIQDGDFVDFQNGNSIFNSSFASEGWSFVSQGLAGVQVSVTPRFGVVLDGRYLFAKGDPGTDLSGFDKIDLSGFTGTLGLSVRL